MIVRELIARFGIKTDPKGIQTAEQSMQRLVGAAKGLVVAIGASRLGAAIADTVQQTANAADMIDKMSLRIGLSAKALQELDFVAQLSGTSLSEFEVAIRKLQLSADKAATGSKEYAKNFKRLGVSVKDSSGRMRSAEELLPLLADGFRGLKTDTERTALAQQLLGRAGTSLIPVLIQGTDAINAQRKEASEFGIMSEELIKLSTTYIDNQVKVSKAVTAVSDVFAKALLPSMIRSQEWFLNLIKANRDWIGLKLGNVTRKVAEAVERLGRFTERVARFFVDWIANMSPLQKGLLAIGVAAAAIAALLLLPSGSLILLGLLIAGIIDDFEVWREGGKSAIGLLIGDFKGFEDRLAEFRKSGIGQLISAFETFGQTVSDIMFTTIQFIIDLFTEGPAKAAKNFLINLDMISEGTVEWVTKFAKVVGSAFEAVFDPLWAMFRDAFNRQVEEMLGDAKRLGSQIASALGIGDDDQPKITRLTRSGEMEPRSDKTGRATTVSRLVPERISTIARGANAIAAGVGSLPVATRIASGRGAPNIVNAPRTNLSINVQAPPGANAQDVADLVERRTATVLERERRTAMRAFTTVAGG